MLKVQVVDQIKMISNIKLKKLSKLNLMPWINK